MEFSAQLKAARMAAGLTQQQVADSMGITNSTYCGYETGKRQPDVAKIKQLSKILGITADELLGIGLEDTVQIDPPYSNEAKALAHNYDRLDKKGKDAVTALVSRELTRISAECELEKFKQDYINSFTVFQVCEQYMTDSTGIDLTQNLIYKKVRRDIQLSDAEKSDILLLKRIHAPLGVYFSLDVQGEVLFIIDNEKIPGPLMYGLFTINEKSYIKRLDGGKLYPLQSNYEPISQTENIRCEGAVVACLPVCLVEDL